MISFDEGYVESAAPNSDAMKNGRGLVVKGKFLALYIDAEETILFGKCQGRVKSLMNVPATLPALISRPIVVHAQAGSSPANTASG